MRLPEAELLLWGGVACVQRVGIVGFQIGASRVICNIDYCLAAACANGVARQGLRSGERLHEIGRGGRRAVGR